MKAQHGNAPLILHRWIEFGEATIVRQHRALRAEADPRSVALAAIRLYHEAAGNTVDEHEIPDVQARPERKFEPREQSRTRESGGTPQAGTAFIYVGVGRKAGIRPNDLVGAIANETGLTGREIGPIRITDTYSVVGVPETRLDSVIDQLKNTVIRGKAASVRRYVDNGQPSRGPSEGHRGSRPTGYEGKKPYAKKTY
jgi:ATP-dependent RNA helicase DeaD